MNDLIVYEGSAYVLMVVILVVLMLGVAAGWLLGRGR